MAPSCVPASAFESPRRPLAPGDLEALMRRNRVLGLAEMMNFPGVIAGDPAELEKLALDGAEHVDGHAPGVLGKAAPGVRGGRDPLGPRGSHGGGGARAASRRDVAPDPRGVDGTKPRGAPSARRGVRPRPDRLLHRRPRSRGHRRQRPRERDGPRRRRVRDRACGRDPHGLAASRPSGTACPGTAPSPPGTSPTSSCSPDLERFVPELVLKRGRPIEDRPRAEVPEWVRPDGPRASRHRGGLRDPVGGWSGTRDRADRGPGGDGVARARAAGRGRARGVGPRRATS